VDSKRISFELLQTGKTIGEIAAERSMAPSTIEGHLAWFIGNGDLNVNQFIPADKVEIISKYLLKNTSYSIGQAKAALGNDITYAELRFVLNHLKYKEKSETT